MLSGILPTKLTEKQILEDHLMMYATLIGFLTSFLGTISNILLGMSLFLILSAFPGLVFYPILYVQFLRGRQKKSYYSLISVFTILYLNLLWYANNQGNGPVLYLMVVCYLFVLLIPQKMNLKLIVGTAFINLLSLFLYDIYFPSIIGGYKNLESRLFDIYFMAFLSVFLLLVIVSVFKKYYLKELVRAQESDKLKSAFLDNLSHEIRTPLNAIIGFSSIIAEESEDPEKMEFARMIQENGNQLSSLVDKLMILSKIESGNIELTPKEININTVFEKLLKEFTPQSAQKQLGFEYLIRGSHTFNTDVKMLTLVLTEMISNAMKFSKKGNIRFGAICKAGQCIFFVKDFGIGIRDENLEKIFDRFVKIDEYTSVMVRGVGIGLCLSKKVIEQLGGQIKVKSTYKKGSVFYFTIPAIVSE
jgi:signal transduction histidine kinase